MRKIYLLTSGDGSDGNEWAVISIHRTHEGALNAKRTYEIAIERSDGTFYHNDSEVEEWDLKE
jgi:hypothetical protein